MKNIFNYISDYYTSADKRIVFACIIFISLFIYLNYQYQLEKKLCFDKGTFTADFTGHYIIYAIAFIVPYLFYFLFTGKNYLTVNVSSLLFFIAPAVFALKVSLNTGFHFTSDWRWNSYWNKIFYWPFLLAVTAIVLFLAWKIFRNHDTFYGLTTKNFNWTPYFIMLLCMVPLIAAASTQPDFLRMYPKVKSIEQLAATTSKPWLYKLLYEISYGSDFITIELFFRGFLILGFLHLAGKDAILPMACFYCTIHFGKPLGECISSFFGGLLLGIVVYNTRSIFGGLVVHLGIAWLMELGGGIGNFYKK